MAMVKSPVAGFVEISWHGRLQCDGLTFLWKVFLFNMVCQAQIGQLGSLGAKCICSFWPLIICKLPQVLCYITSNSSNPEWLACSRTDWSWIIFYTNLFLSVASFVCKSGKVWDRACKWWSREKSCLWKPQSQHHYNAQSDIPSRQHCCLSLKVALTYNSLTSESPNPTGIIFPDNSAAIDF